MQLPEIESLHLCRDKPPGAETILRSVSPWGSGYLVLLDMERRDEQRRREWSRQDILVMKNGQIVDAWQAPESAIWECVLGLSHSRYLLGSAHPYQQATGALLLCSFRDPESAAHQEQWRRSFNKGLLSHIDHLARTTDGNLSVRGTWYKTEAWGGHDEHLPVSWEARVNDDGDEVSDSQGAPIDHRLLPEVQFNEDSKHEGGYVRLETHALAKYDAENQLLWHHPVGEEKTTFLSVLAPYYRTKAGVPSLEGAWLGGRQKRNYSISLAHPVLAWATEAGVQWTRTLHQHSCLNSVEMLVPLADGSCVLVGETLETGKGQGLYVMRCGRLGDIQNLHYLNMPANNTTPEVHNKPAFSGLYLDTQAIHVSSAPLDPCIVLLVFVNLRKGRDRMATCWKLRIDTAKAD